MSTVLYVKAARPSWAVQGSKPSTQDAGAQGQPVYTWISEATEKRQRRPASIKQHQNENKTSCIN